MYCMSFNTWGLLIDNTLYYTLLLFLFYSCYFSFSTFYINMLTCYMHVHLPLYFYTPTRSFDSLDLHIRICGYLSLIRYLERITCILRSWSPSLLDYWYSCSFVHVIFWFYLYRIQLPFLSFIHLLSLC